MAQLQQHSDTFPMVQVWFGDSKERELLPQEMFLAVYAAGGGKRNMANFVKQPGEAKAPFRTSDVHVYLSPDADELFRPSSKLFVCRYASSRGEWVPKPIGNWSHGQSQLKLIPEWFKAKFWDNKQEKKHPWFMFGILCEAFDGSNHFFTSNAFPVHQYYPTGVKKTDPNDPVCRMAFHKVLKQAPSTMLRPEVLLRSTGSNQQQSSPAQMQHMPIQNKTTHDNHLTQQPMHTSLQQQHSRQQRRPSPSPVSKRRRSSSSSTQQSDVSSESSWDEREDVEINSELDVREMKRVKIEPKGHSLASSQGGPMFQLQQRLHTQPPPPHHHQHHLSAQQHTLPYHHHQQHQHQQSLLAHATIQQPQTIQHPQQHHQPLPPFSIKKNASSKSFKSLQMPDIGQRGLDAAQALLALCGGPVR